MATEFAVSSRQIPAGETIVAAPPQLTRCGPILVAMDGTGFPGDADLQFLTLVIEVSEDNWQTVLEVARVTRSGRARAQPTSIYVEQRNRDKYLVPWAGRMRARVVAKAQFVAALSVKIEDALDPPALTPVPNSVAHDGETNVFVVGNFVASITAASKTTAGADRCGIAHVGGQVTGAATALTGVTWGGNAMTQIGTGVSNADIDAYLWRYLDPPTGASDVVASFGDDVRVTLGTSSYNGVLQSGPVQSGSPVTNSGTVSAPSVDVTSDTGNMVVDSVFYDAAAPLAAGGGQTQIGSDKTTVGGDYGGGCSYEAGAASTTMSWDSADAWVIIAASLVSAAGAPEPNPLTVRGFIGRPRIHRPGIAR